MKHKTLCEWSKSEISRNKKKLIALIKDSTYYCKKCARSANDESLLCKPEIFKKQ